MIETILRLLIVGMFFTFLLQIMGCFVWYKWSKTLEYQSKQLHERLTNYEKLAISLDEKVEKVDKIGRAFETMYHSLDTEMSWESFLELNGLKRIN